MLLGWLGLGNGRRPVGIGHKAQELVFMISDELSAGVADVNQLILALVQFDPEI